MFARVDCLHRVTSGQTTLHELLPFHRATPTTSGERGSSAVLPVTTARLSVVSLPPSLELVSSPPPLPQVTRSAVAAGRPRDQASPLFASL